ncbi:tryptophanyl-tRNA synthetase [Quadrisphaera granulorum]|uniref:Tryptophan--tRNA ligase n=1 Tax=Quadrisphaera granulorum TaxID=317664 RepID=A0A315ZU22_9ACTN|nr:tryptophan--tRNA ligase [Quadrisphaera granulorum]PWJ48819.1 tryptophanyl-tRNA synthetase [Quadrisphaera granulorum]SZE98301.1 tryptophanyl-tRNA synthetase [Quadrisphaera granulorum]
MTTTATPSLPATATDTAAIPTPDDSFAVAAARSAALEAEVADDPGRFRVLTGDRPTGPLHLGHYVGTLANRVRLQEAGVDVVLVVADYQVITDRDGVGTLSATVLELVADYLAAGIDPSRTTVFAHSAVPALNQLMLPFLSLVTDAELRRNPTVKSELAATGGRPLSGLLLTYPVHQAADVLFCKAHLVPVGRDQLPHLEVTRTVARRFNERYAGGRQIFPEPDALLTAAPVLLGTDGTKMSKSRRNAIELRATEDETARLLRGAKTDSERGITYEPERRPEVASLLLLAALLSGQAPEELAAQVGSGGGGALKALVTEAVNEHLRPLRARRAELVADPGHRLAVLRAGNERANALADATLAEVRSVMDMTY